MGTAALTNMAYADQEIVLRSKDEREFKVKFGTALMSETIKALSSFPEDEDDKEDWDKKFAGVDDDTLFSLILAANYLDIKSLLDLTCKTVADYIKACKTPQEIRRRFNIKNDFTPEEEEEVRKENAWCEER